jgi:hypothetical protein
MPIVGRKTNKFHNSREWRSFVSAGQSAASYPSVMRALKAGQAWLSHAWTGESPARISAGLMVEEPLVSGAGETVGV